MSDNSASEAATAPAVSRRFFKIATEEAFNTPEIATAFTALASDGDNMDLNLIRLIYGSNLPWGTERLRRLRDTDEERIRIMDENGVDMHLLSLTSPGVQLFQTDDAVRLAASANDWLAAAVARHPDRFAGLASFAPQAPAAAAKEMERAINSLKLNGFVVNSHTRDRYLDEEEFWPILEAAEALDAPIYIHPRAPADSMSGPFRAYGNAMFGWGYGMETSTHAIRLIVSGIFDRFPGLRIVLGHMGEAIPFWLSRVDWIIESNTSVPGMPKLQMKPSEYFKRNFVITTSGQENHLALDYSVKMIGADNVMWAIDYPYQETGPAVAFIENAPLEPDVLEKICHLNAERVFKIRR